MRRLINSSALVSAFMDTLTPAQRDVALAIQSAIVSVAPDLRQEVKWGNLCFLQEHDNLMAIVLHKAQAHLQIFNGVMLGGEFPELEGIGKGMRFLKFKYRKPVDIILVKEITQASIDAAGLRFSPAFGHHNNQRRR